MSSKERKIITLRSLLSQYWYDIEKADAYSPDLQRAIHSLNDFLHSNGGRVSINQLVQNLETLKKHQVLPKSTIDKFFELISMPMLSEEEALTQAQKLHEIGRKKLFEEVREHINSQKEVLEILEECIHIFNHAAAFLEPYKTGKGKNLYITLGTYLARCSLLKHECLSFPDPENLLNHLNLIDHSVSQVL